MKLSKEEIPLDSIYGELAKLIKEDVVDFDTITTDGSSESSHYALKLVAKKILESRGFQVDAPRSEIMGQFDVIAKKDDYQVNVEVGITPAVRIWSNLTRFNEVWHIPYDHTDREIIYVFKRGKHYWHYQDFMNNNTDIMVKCPKCSKPNFLQANYCGYCGHNLAGSLPICRTCGQQLPRELLKTSKPFIA